MCTFANEVFFVTDSLLANDSNRGGAGGSSLPSGAGLSCHLNCQSLSFDCTKRQPESTLSNVDLPAPVHPITTRRLRSGSVRSKSSSVLYRWSNLLRRAVLMYLATTCLAVAANLDAA